MVKEDYVAAIWVDAMDFSSIFDKKQEEIRKFVSWMTEQTLNEMVAVARKTSC